jgi:hypothetical protein
MNGLEQGNHVPELVIIEEHSDFGEKELNVESRGILLCVVPQDDLLNY